MADVNLVDLEVIKRYSLAIRQESAPADEVLAVLELSRDAVLAAMAAEPRPRKAPAPKRAAAKVPAKRAPAKKVAKAVKKGAKGAKKASSARRSSR
jgi:hypothetical protein